MRGWVKKDAKVAMWVESETMEPSMLSEKSCIELVRELGPVMMISNLLQLLGGWSDGFGGEIQLCVIGI